MGAPKSASDPHSSSIYVESGRIGRAFLPLSVGTLLLAIGLAWALAWSRMHWSWPVMAVAVATLVLTPAIKASIAYGRCRRTSAGVGVAALGGVILYLGSWIIGYQAYVVGAGSEAVEAVRTSSGFDGVFGWYVFAARREPLGSPLSSVVHVCELGLVMGLAVGAAFERSRRVFDEVQQVWAERRAIAFRATDLQVVSAALQASDFAALARLPRLRAEPGTQPGLQLLVDYFEPSARAPTYLGLRIRGRAPAFRRLSFDDAERFWTLMGRDVGHEGASDKADPAVRAGDAADETVRSGPASRSADPSSPVQGSWRDLIDPSAAVGRASRGSIVVLALVIGVGLLGLALGIFAEAHKVGREFPEPWGAVHDASILVFLGAAASFCVILAVAAPIERWSLRRRLSQRPGSSMTAVPDAEHVFLNVCERHRYDVRRPKAEDHGFWVFDLARRRVLFEGLRERWAIDGRDVRAVEVLQTETVDALLLSFEEHGRRVELILFDVSLRGLFGLPRRSPVYGWVDRFRACLGLGAPTPQAAPAPSWQAILPGALILALTVGLGSIPFRQWRAPDLGDMSAAEARLREPTGFFGRVQGRVAPGSVTTGKRQSQNLYLAFDLGGQTAGLLVSGSESRLRELGALDVPAEGKVVSVAGFIDDSVPAEVGPLLEDATGLRVPSDARVIRVGVEPHARRNLGATIALVLGGLLVASYATYQSLRSR